MSMFLGSAGTGGISSSKDWLRGRADPDPLLPGRCGLGVRKVRSVIEPLLPRLRKPDWSRKGCEAVEATEALRRCVRFVCTSATRIGVVGRARRAAAAAAADKELFDSWRLKTAAAAVAALGFAVAAAVAWHVSSLVARLDTQRDAGEQGESNNKIENRSERHIQHDDLIEGWV
ncbi:hypothetical protein NEMBOFW57_001735 [Staphylotrichum longicolle]|uniref:Uncharacterized protein n=1 Tax=Staphylotrichum longicolle TaxID=669026 RepID=A0AAD4F1R3_9PEZI|nr:hypothetical protein NEMBOFW57_001735 [Staphylotrichum longicolle]